MTTLHVPPTDHVVSAGRGVARVLVAVLAGCLGGCVGDHLKAIFGTGPEFVITFADFNPKLIAGEVEDDGDATDVVVKSRATFKPSKGSTAGLNKRMKLKAKADGGAATLATDVDLTGNVEAKLRVAVDKLDGLVDGTSLGFLERRAAGKGPVERLEAVWNAGIDGFTIRALEDGSPTGGTLDLPGAHEAVLVIDDNGPDFTLYAGAPTDESFDNLLPEAELATLVQAPGTDFATYAFGAEGLGPKGTLWFARFTLECQSNLAVAPVEQAIGAELIQAQQALEDAEELLASGASGAGAVQSMDTLLAAASQHLGDSGALGLLQAALDQQTLQPITQGVAAEKNIQGAVGAALPASQVMHDAMLNGGTSIKPVKSAVAAGIKKTEVALAQIAGFKSNSHGKLEQVLDFMIKP